MRIKMKATAAGPDASYLENKTYNVPDQMSQKFADSLIEGGYAEEVTRPVKESETASIGPDETATSTPSRKKKNGNGNGKKGNRK